MQDFIIILRVGINGIVENKVFYTTTRENAEKVANENIDRFSSMGAVLFSAKIYEAKQIGFPNQI